MKKKGTNRQIQWCISPPSLKTILLDKLMQSLRLMKLEAMERRFNRNTSNEGLQKKLAENKLLSQKNQVPDLTDFMNDMFFGTIDADKKAYNLTGTEIRAVKDRKEDEFDSSTGSVSSRKTQEWLEEAKRMVARSPSRGADSPSRLGGSPRFAMSQAKLSPSSVDRRDPFSRSARRHRAGEGFSGEILLKTSRHTRNRSETNLDSPQGEEKSDTQKWLKFPDSPPQLHPTPSPPSPPGLLLPPRQSTQRKSRFQTNPNAPLSQPIPTPAQPTSPAISGRTFKNTTGNGSNPLDAPLLSPPKHLVESAHRRSISSTTCSILPSEAMSPPWNLVESTRRRSVSSSACSSDRIIRTSDLNGEQLKEGDIESQELNVFLKEQRIKMAKILSGEMAGTAKIVLSGPSNSTSSMVAAICYAWLLENRMRTNNQGGDNMELVVPVMNMRRGKMWKQRQAAWLFHHVGLDSTALLFSNEVDLETLMMAKQLNMFVVGEDILKTNGEVGSACTILTDNYCEDAYDLLQTPILKKLLLAGILLDTQNLNLSQKLSMTRDSEAVQLLTVGCVPNYRNTIYDQLMQDHRDNNFFEVLRHRYGRPPDENTSEGRLSTDHRVSERIPSTEELAVKEDNNRDDTKDVKTKKVSPASGKPTPSPKENPAKPPPKPADASPGKNKPNFFAKLFGFGRK